MSTVMCLGETMAMVTPEPGTSFPDVSQLLLSPGGAESNVALSLAASGVDTSWVSRLGDDEFGDVILARLRAGGVDVGGVERDPSRQTGLYLKLRSPEPGRPGVRYYRAGSAASAMAPALLNQPAVEQRLAGARLVHLSGITPALSADCLELVRALVARPRSYRVSFDVNFRPALWEGAPDVLLEIAAACDVVFVGADEARAAFGLDSVEDVMAALPGVPDLVVKDDSRAAHHRQGGVVTTVPSLTVDVVDAVGAGDSFAAGFLVGLLAGRESQACLRAGHAYAAMTLTHPSDRATPPASDTLDRLLGAGAEEWEAIRADRLGFHVGERAQPTDGMPS